MIATPGLTYQDAEQYPINVSHVRSLDFLQDQEQTQLGVHSSKNPQNFANRPDCSSNWFPSACIPAGPITPDQLNLEGSFSYPTWPVELSNLVMEFSDQSDILAEASLQGFEAAQGKDAPFNTSTTHLEQCLTSTRDTVRKDAGLRTCVSCHVAKKKVTNSAPSYVTPTNPFPIFSVLVFHCVQDVRSKQKGCLLPLISRDWGLRKPCTLICVSYIVAADGALQVTCLYLYLQTNGISVIAI